MNSLGQGAYAEVKEGVHENSHDKVALKFYDKYALLDPMKKNNVTREIRILEALNHPNIMKIFDCIDGEKKVVIVLEHINGTSLKKFLAQLSGHKLSEGEAQPILRQILEAVAYFHEKGVTHRDLKLENILLTPERKVKIIDFGFSTWTKKDFKLKTFCGTPTYMAPEIINKNEYEGPPTDMWALGVIFFALLCGAFPFQGMKDANELIGLVNRELYRRIKKGVFSIPDHVSAGAKKLLNGFLCVDPSKRMTASSALLENFFTHPESLRLPSIEHSLSN